SHTIDWIHDNRGWLEHVNYGAYHVYYHEQYKDKKEMKVTETKLADSFVIEPTKLGESRGYFFDRFNERTFQEQTGSAARFVQDNQSFSTRGVLRGLHAQRGEYAQAKLVRVLQGAVLDVMVDARPESPTFGQYETIELSAENNLQAFIPRGFLHGF